MLTTQTEVNYKTGASSSTTGRGQGKKAATILADQGDYVTVITDVDYASRSRHLSAAARGRGARPMHRTTLTLPTQTYTDYNTTNKKTFEGSRALTTEEISRPYPSQHTSQLNFRHRGESPQTPWNTYYNNIYYHKGTQPAGKLHEPSFHNKMNMNEGSGMKDVMTGVKTEPAYWSQYTRIHNKLGAMLGHGEARDRPVRKQYNPLTGQETGAAWRPENNRISGNRVLYHNFNRKDSERDFILG